jgi:hypothetical protein
MRTSDAIGRDPHTGRGVYSFFAAFDMNGTSQDPSGLWRGCTELGVGPNLLDIHWGYLIGFAQFPQQMKINANSVAVHNHCPSNLNGFGTPTALVSQASRHQCPGQDSCRCPRKNKHDIEPARPKPKKLRISLLNHSDMSHMFWNRDTNLELEAIRHQRQ